MILERYEPLLIDSPSLSDRIGLNEAIFLIDYAALRELEG